MIFEFKGFHDCDSKCEIDIFGKVVIATQLDNEDIPGTSITNAAEMIAEDVCNKYKIPYDELIWIEHYKKEEYYEETYKIVQFKIENGGFIDPKWRKISLKELADIIIDQCGHENINNYVNKNIKKLKRDYTSKLDLLQAMCQHKHSTLSKDGKKKYCYFCGVELQ